MNFLFSSRRSNNTMSQIKANRSNNNTGLRDFNDNQNEINDDSQYKEDIFENDDMKTDKKDGSKQENKSPNSESFHLSDSSPFSDTEEEIEDGESNAKNKASKDEKKMQRIQPSKKFVNNKKKDDSDGYFDLSEDKLEEDESEIDVSEEIKIKNKKLIENKRIKNDSSNDYDDFDLHGLTSSSSQIDTQINDQQKQSLVIIEEEEEEEEEEKENERKNDFINNSIVVKSTNEQSPNKENNYFHEKTRLNHVIKQELSRIEIESLLEASFLGSSLDLYFVNNDQDYLEDNFNEGRKDQQNETVSYNENAEEEIMKKHRRRKHRKYKYEYETEKKSLNNDELHGNDEIEIIINNSSDDEMDKSDKNEDEKDFFFEEDIKKEKRHKMLQKEEEFTEKVNRNFSEVEDDNTIIAKDKKDENKNLFEKQIENDKNGEEEDEKCKNLLNKKEQNKELIQFEEEEKKSQIEKVSSKEDEKEQNSFNEEEIKKNQIELVILKEEEEELESQIKNISIKEEETKSQIELIMFEEEEEMEIKMEKNSLNKEEETKSQIEPILFEEEEEKMETKIEKNSLNEEEEMKSQKDFFSEEEELIDKIILKIEKELDESKSEEEANETTSCIPSEQFGMDLNISPIKKKNKARNPNLENLIELSKNGNSVEIQKSSFKQKILQQFSNEEPDENSDTKEEDKRSIQNSFEPPQSLLSNSASSITNPNTSVDEVINKEHFRKKIRRRKKIQIDKKIDVDLDPIDSNTNEIPIQQKPIINKRVKKRSINRVIQAEELDDNVNDENNNFKDEPAKIEKNSFISTPVRTRKVVKKRSRSAQKPQNNQSLTPTEIEIPSLKTKKLKPRSESAKRTKKHKKPLSDMSTQTDKFQIDENQIFVFEKVKSKNTYHFITNNKYYDLEIINENTTETTDTTDNYHPIINKRRKRNVSPLKKKKSPVSKSKKNVDDDEIKKFTEKIRVKRNQPPRRNMSEQPRARKQINPIEDFGTDDNIVIDFGDTMYDADQPQFSPQSKIEAKKKEELNSRYHLRKKSKNEKSSPIQLFKLTTAKGDSIESESSDVFRNDSDKINTTNNKRPTRTNHQWDMDEINPNDKSSSKNKTLKTKAKTKSKSKTRSKKRSKSTSNINKKNSNSNNRNIEVDEDNIDIPYPRHENKDQHNRNGQNCSIQILPVIKKRTVKMQRKQKKPEVKTYDGNDKFENDNDYDRFNYDDDIKHQKQLKNDKNGIQKKRFGQTLNNVKKVDLLRGFSPIDQSEQSQNRYYSTEDVQRPSNKANQPDLTEAIEITDSIVYETDGKLESYSDYSDNIKEENSYEPPKELFDCLELAFHSAAWDAALKGIYNMDILQIQSNE